LAPYSGPHRINRSTDNIGDMKRPGVGHLLRRSVGHHEMQKAIAGRLWPVFGLLALTLASFGVAIFVPIVVIPALFLSALLVRIIRFPWQWLLVLALVLLGLTAITPSFGWQGLSDGLGVTAYAVTVVACSAGLIEAFGERRRSLP
jgi:energy-coupling factor transporter transmembrane protein EcfT